ncbi:MAG: type IV pilus assembly protein PilC [Verrucomicrobiales bacterium]|jgi:type IV pilus assembly protein PilC
MRFTPKDRFILYSELAKLLEAGFPLESALDTLEHHPLPEPCMHFVRSVKQRLSEGTSITEAVCAIEDIEITGVETNLIKAGERGGKLEDVFAHLAIYFERLHEARRSVLRGLIYPAVVLHVAAFVPALPKMVAGQGISALGSSFLILAVYYGLAALVYLGYRMLHRQSIGQGRTDRLLGSIPVLGKLRQMLALERFAEVFRIYLLSAFRPSEAISAAADASQSGNLREQSAVVSTQLVDGEPLGSLLLANNAFPKDFAAGMSTAEQAGTLDKELQRWSKHYAGRVREGFAQMETLIPKFIYAAICIYVVWTLFSFYSGYFSALSQF